MFFLWFSLSFLWICQSQIRIRLSLHNLYPVGSGSATLDVMLWIQLQGEPDSNRPPSLEESFRQADTSLELNNPDSANSNDSHHKKVYSNN